MPTPSRARLPRHPRRTLPHPVPTLGLLCVLGAGAICSAQTQPGQAPPRLATAPLPGDLRLDGVLSEPAWMSAPAIDGLTTVEPNEGGKPTGNTTVRVLVDQHHLVFGIRCDDPSPAGIVSYAINRDASLFNEDHVKIVLGTYLDGRTGFVFAVNPSGARYDAVVARRGESEDRSWDGVWEAETSRDEKGWSAEIRIPARTLTFREGITEWHLNVQRKIQRLLETSRWTGASRDYRVTQTSRAGLLTSLPVFDLGLGLNARPSGVLSFGRPNRTTASGLDGDGSLDVAWRPTSDLTASLTFNTDFAETEVDSRRTNLTRFPLFFPEKRAFFIEGAEVFDFGLSLSRSVQAYHSRRIGLVNGTEVPILAGAKLTGRLGGTSLGVIGVRTDSKSGVAPRSSMGVVRVRQDVLKESSVGIIATAGDPLGRNGSSTVGTDWTYQTSEFLGNRNFLAGVWAMTMDRDDQPNGSESAWGGKVDYPNDLLDIVFLYRRVGENFDPSLGFIDRRGVKRYYFGTDYAPRPDIDWIRQMTYEAAFSLHTDLEDDWESFRISVTPLSFDLESGDEFQVEVHRMGERIDEAFEVADGIEVTPGKYAWDRFEMAFESANKRALNGEIGWSTGEFYTGRLDTYEGRLEWNPSALLSIGIRAEYNEGHVAQGPFTEDVYSITLGLDFSPDLSLRSFVQYDTDSKSLGANTRLHWTATPESNLFFVVNYNAQREFGDMRTEGYDTILKLQHEFRF